MSPTGAMTIIGQYVYFIGVRQHLTTKTAEIWRMRLDGSEATLLGMSESGYGLPSAFTLAVDDGWLYCYPKYRPAERIVVDKRIARFSLTSGEREVFKPWPENETPHTIYLIDAGWLYYQDGQGNYPDGSIMRTRTAEVWSTDLVFDNDNKTEKYNSCACNEILLDNKIDLSNLPQMTTANGYSINIELCDITGK